MKNVTRIHEVCIKQQEFGGSNCYPHAYVTLKLGFVSQRIYDSYNCGAFIVFWFRFWFFFG